MAAIFGSGEHRYRVVDNWAKLPDGWQLTDVASVAVDSKDRIYVFNRGTHPMVVLDRDGSFLRSWGEGLFSRAHGLHIDTDDNLYCTDDGDHTVRKCSTDGKVLLTIGVPEKPAPFMSGGPFHRCATPRVTPDGRLIKSWGEPGTDRLAHEIACKKTEHGNSARGRRPMPIGALIVRLASVLVDDEFERHRLKLKPHLKRLYPRARSA